MRRLLRILTIIVVFLLVLSGIATGYIITTARKMLPQVDGTLSYPGLDGKITIYRDAQGVPQIYATTTHDLFFAQGVVQAQDRWWQMEFSRHIGEGRISELVGKTKDGSVLDSDIFIRTLGWNRAAQHSLDAASPDSIKVLNAFSDGVNAYIAGKSGPDLAVEYSLLSVKGIKIPIEQWKPLDTIAFGMAQAWSLSGNASVELDTADLIKKLGSDSTAMLKYFYVPYSDKHETILSANDLPIKPDPVASGQTLNIPAYDSAIIQAANTSTYGDANLVWPLNGGGAFSNNWVVSGKLTQSGKPLLANDPHLGISMPSVWYQIGLHCVQVSAQCPYDVEGFTFPASVGIVIGHNARIAWGVTNVNPLDTQDLYVISVDPQDDTKYQLDGKTLKMDVIKETIRFGDDTPPLDIRVRETHFGPIMTDAPSYAKRYEKPLAMRWIAVAEPYDLEAGILGVDRATDWPTFRQALSNWKVPSQNFVYADIDGNIGYQMPGLVPIRAKGHDGLLPIDGSTTKYDWKGYIPFEYLPHVENPAKGYIETANQVIVPEAYFTSLASALGDKYGADSNYHFGVGYDPGYRAQRIADLIKAKDKHSVDTFKAIQGDTYDGSAAEVLPFALKLDFGGDVPKEVIDWMGKWDYQETMNSGQAALYNIFYYQLTKQLWGDQMGYIPFLVQTGPGTALLLNDPNNVWWDDVTTTDKKETRDDIIKSAFIAAYKEASKTLGADYKTWKWGTIHTATFVSTPLGASGIDAIESYVNAGPVPTNGGLYTIDRATYLAEDPYHVANISSMRMIVDFADFNNSQWIIPTGQSGHPASGHYRDQIEQWRTTQYNTMVWDQDTVKQKAVSTLTLTPR